MALMNPDFSQELKPLTPGQYSARVASYKPFTSNKSEKGIKWKLDVLDTGETIEHLTMCEGRGAGMLKQFLKSCDGTYDGGAFDPDSYIGARLGIEIGEREYDGKTYATVKKVYMVDSVHSEDVPF